MPNYYSVKTGKAIYASVKTMGDLHKRRTSAMPEPGISASERRGCEIHLVGRDPYCRDVAAIDVGG